MYSDNRIGIFLCNCKKVIAKKINFIEIIEYFKDFENVEYIEENDCLCDVNIANNLKQKIKKNSLNKVIIAACSPQLKGSLFENIFYEAGINNDLISFANLREQCAMLFFEKDIATRNAIKLIKSLIKRITNQPPIYSETVKMKQSVLIIGGGLAGLQTALNLSKLSYNIFLIERENQLGGSLNSNHLSLDNNISKKEFISKLIGEVTQNNKVKIFKNTELQKLEGFVGNFEATVEIKNKGKKNKTKNLNIGAIILATGCQNYLPVDKYGINMSPRIMGMSQLIKLLAIEHGILKNGGSICFISGIISDDQRVQGESLLKASLLLKKEYKSQVYIICKNVFVAEDGLEELYEKTRSKGVLFIKHNKGAVEINFRESINTIDISLNDPLLGLDLYGKSKKLTISCNFLILEEEIIPSNGSKELSKILQINTDINGFYQNNNISLQPIFTNRKGIFVVGSCRGPRNISQTIDDSAMAALEVHSLLEEKKIRFRLDGAIVDDNKCTLCLTCLRTCPHKAVRLVKNTEPNQTKIEINNLACERCGLCVSHCPANAIVLPRYKNNQILAEIIN